MGELTVLVLCSMDFWWILVFVIPSAAAGFARLLSGKMLEVPLAYKGCDCLGDHPFRMGIWGRAPPPYFSLCEGSFVKTSSAIGN